MTNKDPENKSLNHINWIIYPGMALLFFSVLFNACYKTSYYDGNDVKLRFSTDTLVFDTVFTTVGSATRILKVYNDLDKAIELNAVYLEEGEQSKFRLNIDGVPTALRESVEIAAGDSIYIFGEVTVDPNEPLDISPFVIYDQLVFEVNGNKQSVLLEAWGQNANYIPGKFARGKVYLSTCDFGTETWDDPKPYVVYGTLLIDSCTLVLPEGTQLYFHGGFVRTDNDLEYNDGQLYIMQHGKLLVEGSSEKPVIFQTDRLEHKYDDISGLWSGLYFLDGSSGNKIEYAILKNANIGIFLDSATTLDLSYTAILHNISAGIFAQSATLNAYNCLIADSGAYGLVGRFGGEYNMDHCTVANYDNQQEALYLGNYRCDDPSCSTASVLPLKARFRNCIFYGNGDDEVFLEDITEGDEPAYFEYNFENCLVAVDELLHPSLQPDFFENCLNCLDDAGEEPLFQNIYAYNFRPDTNAVIIDNGMFISSIADDLDGLPRDNRPDIGCYEFR
jgi:hypothetical protein